MSSLLCARPIRLRVVGRTLLYFVSNPAGIEGRTHLHGLRQNERDRSNVAIQTVGSTSEGEITLRLTVFPGEPNSSARGLYEERLAPGEFRQSRHPG